MFESGRDIANEVFARVTIALGLGVIFGMSATLLALPYVLRRSSATMRERSERLARIGTLIMVLVSSSAVLGVLVRWIMGIGLLNLTNHAYILLWFCLSSLVLVATVVWHIRGHTMPTTKLVRTFSSPATRRFLLIAGVSSLLSAFSNQLVPRTSAQSRRSTRTKPSGPNIVLVTFDALSAEDMSLYGYHLPTTPNIDSLAESSFVFSNFYASSTFTTPSIVSTLTGRYPSNTHVYHYGGRLKNKAAAQTLPRVLRAGGYTTAASVANPGARPDCLGFGDDFDVLPSAPILDYGARELAEWFHSGALAADAAFAGGIAPYLLEQLSPRLFGRTHSTFPPILSFQQAETILHGLDGPFFLWVHVYAPHFPYLPEPPYLNKFLHSDELRTHSDFANIADLKGYRYSPSKQPIVDKARMRYNEWIAQADDAFGQFMTTLQSSRHSEKTAVIVTADHGESFQGGYIGHGGANQLRPIVHVPLVVRLPGQTNRRDFSTPADQTRLAPTILEIAKMSRPEWMDGQSLSGVMRGENSTERPLAFTEYFETNSAFKAIEHGSVGVIDGQHQYVFNLESKTGSLYKLDEAHEQKFDLALIEPGVVSALHEDLGKQFPDLLRS